MTTLPPTTGGHRTNHGLAATADGVRRAKTAVRSAIGAEAQHAAAVALRDRLLRVGAVRDATTAGVYRAVRGEISLDPTISVLRTAGIVTAYPRVPNEPGGLTFHGIAADGELEPGVLGIPAPPANSDVVRSLDVVLVPLVAFDDQCNRLGMGGGYYDTTFARRDPSGRRPALIGVAHDCQRVSRLATEVWDVALDAIATPTMLLVRDRGQLATRT